MRIGFDAKRLYRNFTGLGNYSRSLVKNAQHFHPDHAYYLYTPKLTRNAVTRAYLENPAFHTFVPKTMLKSYWRNYAIVEQLAKDKIDLYHGLSNEIPVNLRKHNIKSVVTIHDVIYKVLPETYPLIDRKIYDPKVRSACKNADTIIAISESTKSDLIELYHAAPEKIEVVYQSCNPLFYTPQAHPEKDDVFQRYDIPAEYLLFVGSLEKRKNVRVLIEAYQHLRPEVSIPIVLVGKGKSYKTELLKLIKDYDLESKVLCITDLKDNRSLQSLYQKATALVYPSLYEGFGLPVVEALLSKTPVITSNVSSLPEAGGPGSLYINPHSPEELAQAITKIVTDPELRNNMVRDGYAYATQMFSPERVTQRLFECYHKTLHSNS